MAQKKKPSAGKKGTKEKASTAKAFIRSEGFAHLRGAIYVMFAAFLLIAMMGYYVTDFGHKGQWLGTLGIGLAAFFTNNLFGFASFGFALLFFIYGMRLWNVKLMPWWKTLGSTLFWMLWLSVTLGYVGGWVHRTNFEPYAGIGLRIAESMHHMIGWWTLVLLLFVAVLMLVVVHKMELPKIKLNRLKADKPRLEEQPSVVAAKATEAVVAEPTAKAAEPVATPTPNVEADKALQQLFNSQQNDVAESETAKEKAQEPMSADTATTEEPTFSIDDEFERVNRKAREKDDVTTTDDVTFSITDPSVVETSTNERPLDTQTESEADEELEPDDYRRHYGLDDPYDPHLDLKDYEMPSTDMLEDWEVSNVRVTKEELIANKDRIVQTLRNYGIEITDIAATPGPTVTLYKIKPAPGVRISKIKSLEDDIALSLSALGIRIIAPIPGEGTVGIEVPNAKPQVVSMKTMLECSAFKDDTKMELPVALGKTISNEPFVTDLAKMPHLLMAGATGTGKSVGLNAVITSLLYKKHPSELKFVLVDPKKVELSLYSSIDRQYLAKMPDEEESIITDVKKVVRTLNSLCIEMDTRYDLLKQAKVRKITEYNEKFCKRMLNPEHGHRYLPYIVLIIDEFGDLIMTAGKEVELPIARLAQLARAVGIHLIIATQRPTTNIITGTIKANFPARIAFRVTSGIDSRTILDTTGAQQLIGRGDMLISLAGKDMVRLQCALIETKEIDRLVKFIGEQRGYPNGFELPEYLDENAEPSKEFDSKQKDEFFNDAARLVVASQFGSTSLLQRKLQLGYNRAGRIIDQLEAAGIVGPPNGSKPRDVLIHDEVSLEDLLKTL